MESAQEAASEDDDGERDAEDEMLEVSVNQGAEFQGAFDDE